MPRRRVFLTNSAVQRMRERRTKRQRSPNRAEALEAKRSTATTTGTAPEATESSASDELPKTVSTAGRILRALGIPALELANLIGVHVSYVDEMLKGTSGKSPIASGHPAWVALSALVSDRLATLMGVREELQGKLELDKKRALERIRRATK